MQGRKRYPICCCGLRRTLMSVLSIRGCDRHRPAALRSLAPQAHRPLLTPAPLPVKQQLHVARGECAWTKMTWCHVPPLSAQSM